jgi:PAB-dependent poly(A)-specific ribonuclease subunit 2
MNILFTFTIFRYYNKTRFSGLETHIANSYCNSEFQMLRFLPGVSILAKNHIVKPCNRERCLCCELGFLLKMMETANGANCQASNFLRTFGTMPEGVFCRVNDEQIDSYIFSCCTRTI